MNKFCRKNTDFDCDILKIPKNVSYQVGLYCKCTRMIRKLRRNRPNQFDQQNQLIVLSYIRNVYI